MAKGRKDKKVVVSSLIKREQCIGTGTSKDSQNMKQKTHNENKKHLKNVGPIHHCEPPHAHSPDVASGTVARRLRIDVHDNDDNDNA